MKLLKIFACLLALGAVASVRANPNVLTTGSWDGSGQNLNDYFALWGISSDPNYVNTGQLNTNGLWNSGIIPSGSTVGMLLEVAGNANQNTFGIYQGSSQTQVFAGSAAAGANASLPIPSGNFGFYLGGVGNTFYSQSSLNAGGAGQLVVYQGPSSASTFTVGSSTYAWDQNSYLLAWEDLPYASSDKDFNDMVLLIRVNDAHVPEGGSTALLIGSGLLAMALAWRRRA